MEERGCRFHLSQAWFRRIQRDKELYKHYMEKTDVYKWLQSFFGLSCISPNEVSNGFVALMSDAPVHAETFTDYILETYVEENSCFPPYLRIIEYSQSIVRLSIVIRNVSNVTSLIHIPYRLYPYT
ncbi:hypothetical protein ACI65C_006615 [Semiaphis heraclei]